MSPHRMLKTSHLFSDVVYWNLLAAVPVVTAAVAIYRHGIGWLVACGIVFAALMSVLLRFYCTHCPHYERGKTVNCMFFWRMPRLFKSRPGKLSIKDKTFAFSAVTAAVLLPAYWLLQHAGLLLIYLLSLGALFWSVARTECGRCIYFECPANRVPEQTREASRFMGE